MPETERHLEEKKGLTLKDILFYGKITGLTVTLGSAVAGYGGLYLDNEDLVKTGIIVSEAGIGTWFVSSIASLITTGKDSAEKEKTSRLLAEQTVQVDGKEIKITVIESPTQIHEGLG